MADGHALLSPSVTRRVVDAFASRLPAPDRPERLGALTDRERQVLLLVARGDSNTEIAGRLLISPLTVKSHVSRLLTKLATRDRAQLVVVAYETGLMTDR